MINIYGISRKSIEEIEILLNFPEDINILSYEEFLNHKKKEEGRFIIIDKLPNLLLIDNLNIIDMRYYNNFWMKKEFGFTKENLLNEFNKKESNLEEILIQHNLPFFNFPNNFLYLTHITEYVKDPYEFLNKVHNILSKTKKETIDCSEKYKKLLKDTLINKENSDLYIRFLNKEKGDYPEIFKFIKSVINKRYKEEIEEEEENED